jgi:hypothetical protein
MDFLNISSLGDAYRYVVKIDKKFRKPKKWEFGSTNAQKTKHGNGNPNQQPPYKQSKTQDKKGKGKMKNDIGKWCDFHKIP